MLRSCFGVGFVVLTVSACGEREQEGFGQVTQPQILLPEGEANDTIAGATPLAGTNVVMRGNVFPSGDIDFYSFTGNAGDTVYAALLTDASIADNDSLLTLFESDGTTVVEEDDDNGYAASSSIAGAALPAAGTYYLRAKNYDTDQIRPYQLQFQLRGAAAPTAESEPNDTVAQVVGQGVIAGSTSAASDVDLYSVTLGAGDTLFASLDLDPERDATEFDGGLRIGMFDGQTLLTNDPGGTGVDSEAAVVTVKVAGTYTVEVNSFGGFGNYRLNLTVHPAAPACTTYTSATVVPIPAGPGLVTSTLNVPDNVLIGDVDVSIALTHEYMPDLDVHLLGPEGNDVGLFTGVGDRPFPDMDVRLDDEAAQPISQQSVLNGMRLQPEARYRLHWLDGQRAQGTWTLQLWDHSAGDEGSLTSWGLTICAAAPVPSCAAGSTPVTVLSTDFEAGDGAFTHSGTADDWARGTPSAAPFTTCNSGTGCFKTNLAGNYSVSSSQDLRSPTVSLLGLLPPITVRWAQKYQLESAGFDHASVVAQQPGGASPTTLFEFLDGTMNDDVGSPSTRLEESAGWGIHTGDISSLAGEDVELVFHLDSDGSNQLGGLAIDDVAITGCRAGGSGGSDGGGPDAGAASGGAGTVGDSGAGDAAAPDAAPDAGASTGGTPGAGGSSVAAGGATGSGGRAGVAGRTGSGGRVGAAGSTAADGGDEPASSKDEASCSCVTVPRTSGEGSGFLFAMAASALTWYRRRRRGG